ncbi:MAG TPA: DUF4118 domain-containing protein [Terriglobales bacterium]|jgi:hypothetical protein|nr:DUF4118 domain-containing protein [Terriglobales bacterium]
MDPLEQERVGALRSEIADIQALHRDLLEFLPRIRDPYARRLWQLRTRQMLEAAAERSALLRSLEAGEQDPPLPPALTEPVLDLGTQARFCDSVGEIAHVEALTREALELVPRIRDPHARRLWKAHALQALAQAEERRAQLAEAEPSPPPPLAPSPRSFSRLRWLDPVLGTMLCVMVAAAATHEGRGWERAPVLPVVFLGVVLAVTRYFGTAVGILGCVLSVAIFALYLFPPFGSFVIEDRTALTSLGALVSGGTGLSYYLGARRAGGKRLFIPTAPS